jgi:hypothetical protein
MHFSPKSIDTLFQKAGFVGTTVKNGSLIYEFFGCLQSTLNVFSKRNNLFFDLVNKKISLTGAFKDHLFDLALNVVLFIPVMLFSFILFVLELISGNSGIILVLAGKLV